MNTHSLEEHVTLRGAGPALSGMLAYPAQGQPRFAALICAPHPNFAGNMENNVVRALATTLAGEALVLRFDYRGIGKSAIRLAPGVSVFDYWSEVEENSAYEDPLEDVHAAALFLNSCAPELPLVLCGYSFGALLASLYGMQSEYTRALAGIAPPFTRCAFDFLADCAKPCLLLSGTRDFVFEARAAAALSGRKNARPRVHLLDGEDHFFRGTEIAAAELIRDFFNEQLATGEGVRA